MTPCCTYALNNQYWVLSGKTRSSTLQAVYCCFLKSTLLVFSCQVFWSVNFRKCSILGKGDVCEGVWGVSVGKQRKSKAPVLADCTFYYSPIKQQALLGMQIPGELKVHKKNEEKQPAKAGTIITGRLASQSGTLSGCDFRHFHTNLAWRVLFSPRPKTIYTKCVV